MSALLLGSTGMVGAHMLTQLRKSASFSKIEVIARRNPVPAEADPKLKVFAEPDTTKWGSHIQSLQPPPDVFFCSFGTTRGKAGGFDNQYKIDHDIPIELAKEAKKTGVKVFVLISVYGANKSSSVPYTRMKGEIEEDIKALDFDHTIILRPQLIGGKREESRPAEAVLRKIADVAGMVHSKLKDTWTQDADVIAKASIAASLKALSGETKEKVTLIVGSDIIKQALTE